MQPFKYIPIVPIVVALLTSVTNVVAIPAPNPSEDDSTFLDPVLWLTCFFLSASGFLQPPDSGVRILTAEPGQDISNHEDTIYTHAWA